MSGTGNDPIASLAGGGTQTAGSQAQSNQLLQLLAKIVVVMQGAAGSNLLNLFTPIAVTASGIVTITQNIGFYSIRKATPAATTVKLLQGGGPYIVADGAGNAGANNITINPPAGYTILETTSYVISTNWGAAGFVLDGTNYLVWSVSP